MPRTIHRRSIGLSSHPWHQRHLRKLFQRSVLSKTDEHLAKSSFWHRDGVNPLFLASCLLFWASNSNAFPSRQGAFDVGVQTMPLSVQSIWNASSSLHSSSNTSLGALDWDFYVKTGSIIFDHLQSGCSLDKPNPPTVSSMKQQGWDIGLIGPVMPSPYVLDYALFLMDSKADQWSYYQARANDKPHNGIADLSI